jgi:hypothetical protein
MADVFISYAREDQQFVRKLQDALEEHNRDTWIDWKDIPRRTSPSPPSGRKRSSPASNAPTPSPPS